MKSQTKRNNPFAIMLITNEPFEIHCEPFEIFVPRIHVGEIVWNIGTNEKVSRKGHRRRTNYTARRLSFGDSNGISAVSDKNDKNTVVRWYELRVCIARTWTILYSYKAFPRTLNFVDSPHVTLLFEISWKDKIQRYEERDTGWAKSVFPSVFFSSF